MKLSIIIPVFNEEKTIIPVLQKLILLQMPRHVQHEMLVVDDGSTDFTVSKIEEYIKNPSAKLRVKREKILFYKHKKNAGKGAAIKTGIEKATGDYIIIQDADLEYNPKDILTLLQEVISNKRDVVYGTRLKRLPHFNKEEKTGRFLLHYIGNRFLSFVTSALYGQWITDMETCYKLFPKSAAVRMHLLAKGFEFEPEITVKLIKAGYRIYEVPIQTKPRSYAEGKKLDAIRDGKKALWILLKYRFVA